MSDRILSLGPVVFRDFELPPSVDFGGQQRLAVHRLVNGRRVIDCLGRDDADIAFSGVFAGPDATLRARTLDALRSSGVEVPLTWDVFFYSVVVRAFTACYRNPTWIPYTLKCTVIRDEAESPIEVVASLTQLLGNDIALASENCAIAGIDMGSASAAITAPYATTYGTTDFQEAQASLATTAMTINAGISVAEQRLSGCNVAADTADGALANLVNGTLAARDLAMLISANGYVGRASTNLLSGASS